jgi:hypothetical protein
LEKNPGNSKKPMGMGKTGFYREKWEKREKFPSSKYILTKNSCPYSRITSSKIFHALRARKPVIQYVI